MNKQNLCEKLLTLKESVKGLNKDQTLGAGGYGYDYVSSSATLKALREKMNELKLLLIPNVDSAKVELHTTGTKKDGSDSKQFMTELTMTFTWVNVENPNETIEVPFYGQGIDSAEKGVGKALTYAEKYFLLKFLNIPTDKDDPDYVANQTPQQPKSQGSNKVIANTNMIKIYANVGYEGKDKAKAAGFRYEASSKRWIKEILEADIEEHKGMYQFKIDII